MASEIESSSNPESEDPYAFLGLEPGATFDEVQKARDTRIEEVGDDSKAKAKIEASYDAGLMTSLKQRQLGKVSTAAKSASQREEKNLKKGGIFSTGTNFLNKSTNPPPSDSAGTSQSVFPEVALIEGQGLVVRLIIGGLILLLLVISTSKSVDLLLALSTIGLFVSQIKRGRRPLPSLGWSVVLLAIGLMLGSFLLKVSGGSAALQWPLSGDQLEGLPAVILLWIGSLLLA